MHAPLNYIMMISVPYAKKGNWKELGAEPGCIACLRASIMNAGNAVLAF
jgi:hypothetical protein